MKTLFTVQLMKGKSWNEHKPMRSQTQWTEHAALMDELADDGFIVLGGPIGDTEDKVLLIIVFGKAKVISDAAQKMNALRAFTEQIIPHRWSEIRPPNANELKATTVLSLPLQEASAKIRTGVPKDDNEDYALDVWAGVIPLKLTVEKPIADEKLKKEVSVPAYVSGYERA